MNPNSDLKMDDQIVHVYHREYSKLIIRNFKTYLDNDLFIDVTFLCKNNKKVQAHQIVLKLVSGFLSQLFIEHQKLSGSKMLYVSVPDINYRTLIRIIQFIYTGNLVYHSPTDFENISFVMKFLGIPHPSIKNQDSGESSESLMVENSVQSAIASEGESSSTGSNKENASHPKNDITTIDLTDGDPRDDNSLQSRTSLIMNSTPCMSRESDDDIMSCSGDSDFSDTIAKSKEKPRIDKQNLRDLKDADEFVSYETNKVQGMPCHKSPSNLSSHTSNLLTNQLRNLQEADEIKRCNKRARSRSIEKSRPRCNSNKRGRVSGEP